MQTEEFLDHVQTKAGLDDRDQAAKTCEAVLGIFGQLKIGGEIRDASSQLPKDIKEMLTYEQEPVKFDAVEFVSRISARLNVPEHEADRAASAVLSTVSAAVTEGQRVELLNQLPNDFSRFATGD